VHRLVSVVCVCYNHARFIREAIRSVLAQTYPAIELIVVDDGSTDGSQAVLSELAAQHPEITLLLSPQNNGYCTSFNRGFRLATGDYIIDLSGDDVLLPQRVQRGVQFFETQPGMGIQFSDAEYIDGSGRPLSLHSARFPHHQVPQGWVFEAVLRRYFICSPTMMISRPLLEALGGYDEQLAYEDFDLWVRAAHRSCFYYLPEVLVQKRLLSGSLASRQFRGDAWHTVSTHRVLKKAKALATGRGQRAAVQYRAAYEAYQWLKRGQVVWALRYAWMALTCW